MEAITTKFVLLLILVVAWTTAVSDNGFYKQVGSRYFPSTVQGVQRFGNVLSCSNDTKRIAVSYDSTTNGSPDGVLFYQYNETTKTYALSSSAPLQSSGVSAATHDSEGANIALSDDGIVLVSQSRFADSATPLFTATAFFYNAGTDSWTEKQTGIKPSELSGTINLMPMAISGDGSVLVLSQNGTGAWTFKYNTTTQTYAQESSTINPGAGTATHFGSAVAVSGDGQYVTVIGVSVATGNESVWVYKRVLNSDVVTLTLVAELRTNIAPTSTISSVSIDKLGNVIAVGNSAGGNFSTGTVWVFWKDASATNSDTWGHSDELVTKDGADVVTGQGSVVKLSSDSTGLVFSSKTADSSQGAIWIYQRVGNQWTQQSSRLSVSDSSPTDIQLGHSLCMMHNASRIVASSISSFSQNGGLWQFDEITEFSTAWTQGSVSNVNGVGCSLSNYSTISSQQLTSGYYELTANGTYNPSDSTLSISINCDNSTITAELDALWQTTTTNSTNSDGITIITVTKRQVVAVDKLYSCYNSSISSGNTLVLTTNIDIHITETSTSTITRQDNCKVALLTSASGSTQIIESVDILPVITRRVTSNVWQGTSGELRIGLETCITQVNSQPTKLDTPAFVAAESTGEPALEVLNPNVVPDCVMSTSNGRSVCCQSWLLQTLDDGAHSHFTGKKRISFLTDVPNVPQTDNVAVYVDLFMDVTRPPEVTQLMGAALDLKINFFSDAAYSIPASSYYNGERSYVALELVTLPEQSLSCSVFELVPDQVRICASSDANFNISTCSEPIALTSVIYDRSSGYTGGNIWNSALADFPGCYIKKNFNWISRIFGAAGPGTPNVLEIDWHFIRRPYNSNLRQHTQFRYTTRTLTQAPQNIIDTSDIVDTETRMSRSRKFGVRCKPGTTFNPSSPQLCVFRDTTTPTSPAPTTGFTFGVLGISILLGCVVAVAILLFCTISNVVSIASLSSLKQGAKLPGSQPFAQQALAQQNYGSAQQANAPMMQYAPQQPLVQTSTTVKFFKYH